MYAAPEMSCAGATAKARPGSHTDTTSSSRSAKSAAAARTAAPAASEPSKATTTGRSSRAMAARHHAARPGASPRSDDAPRRALGDARRPTTTAKGGAMSAEDVAGIDELQEMGPIDY